jgi:hypothetical protein
MTHPSLAANDLRQPDDVYAKNSRVPWRKAGSGTDKERHRMESVTTDKQIIESLSVVEWPFLAQSGHRFEATKNFGLDAERMYHSGRRIT